MSGSATVRRATVWGTPGLLSKPPSLIGVQKIGGSSRQWDIHQGTKPACIANRYRCSATVPSQDTELLLLITKVAIVMPPACTNNSVQAGHGLAECESSTNCYEA